MCGFVFIHDKTRPEGELERRALDALKLMSHRGPDSERIVPLDSVVLGHRRLSIIDIGSSNQPMQDKTGRYTLAYNGELYNYKELRNNLLPHWEFSTQGDTEVVLAGLVTQGEAFLDKMDGMWGLALWDDAAQELLLVRDRIGKKPLYYASIKQGFACASELPSLNVLVGSSWQEDHNSTADYLRYGYYLPGTTAYQGVFEVLPGHVLRWSPGRGSSTSPYWSLPLRQYSGSKREAAAALREKMLAAVKKRLVADVEVGAFLSGGVDSSLIVSMMTRQYQQETKTFTIGFEEASYDESRFADAMARHCGTDHHREMFSGWDLQRANQFILKHIGQPFADSSIFPTASVSSLASRYVKVALSGDGGDELFSGYQRYQARTLLRWYLRLPKLLRDNTAKLIKAMPEPMAHHSHSVLKKAHLFLDIVARHTAETPYVAPVLYSHNGFAELAPDLAKLGHKPPLLPEETELDGIKAMMAADALVYLPQDILVKLDRASMAHSLEARAPFLDREVLELAFSFPRAWHRNACAGKRMLRESLGDFIPDTVWARRKKGFAVPVSTSFPELTVSLRQLLEMPTPLNKVAVLRMIDEHERKRSDYGHKLWSLYVYLAWRHGSKLLKAS
ncbi:asparagine synthase (glutamine-hydrolysing) [Methylococcales bacterium]|nr:asparagine synthase (glutamine-hydrolysing) [Methylococcales bacterium]